MDSRLAAVVIGRNEGDRLVRCLESLKKEERDLHLVYVDSGSVDASVDEAKKVGADVLELDLSIPFTAARARNAGFLHIKNTYPKVQFIQFVDGDCELYENWIETAASVLEKTPELAVVFGHQYERFPDASIWNRLMNEEWANAPVGPARACGGNALICRRALEDVDGYRNDLIAGEEPEMCYRMRQKGWQVQRIDADMGLHDAAMTEMRQWWHRNRRAGHTYAEGAMLHGAGPERYNVMKLYKTLFWGCGVPLIAAGGSLIFGSWALLVLLIWPAQVIRLMWTPMKLYRAFFLTLGKLPETQGALSFLISHIFGRHRRTLIEYK